MNELTSVLVAVIGGGGLGGILSHYLNYRNKKQQNEQDYHLKTSHLTIEQYEKILAERNNEIQRLTGRIEALESLVYRIKQDGRD